MLEAGQPWAATPAHAAHVPPLRPMPHATSAPRTLGRARPWISALSSPRFLRYSGSNTSSPSSHRRVRSRCGCGTGGRAQGGRGREVGAGQEDEKKAGKQGNERERVCRQRFTDGQSRCIAQLPQQECMRSTAFGRHEARLPQATHPPEAGPPPSSWRQSGAATPCTAWHKHRTAWHNMEFIANNHCHIPVTALPFFKAPPPSVPCLPAGSTLSARTTLPPT